MTPTSKTNPSNSPDTNHQDISWRHNPRLNNRTSLLDLLRTCGTITDISREVGCSRYQIYRAMKSHGIQKHERDNARKTYRNTQKPQVSPRFIGVIPTI